MPFYFDIPPLSVIFASDNANWPNISLKPFYKTI